MFDELTGNARVKAALKRMLGGHVADLFAVHAYLNAQRGGDFA